MRFINVHDFGDMLSEKVTSDLIYKAWEIHGVLHNMIFINYFEMEEKCKEHCFREGFDPDTTMVMYKMPRDNSNGEPVSQEVIDTEAAGPTILMRSRCICMFYPNTTPEEMANKINQVAKLKAFI